MTFLSSNIALNVKTKVHVGTLLHFSVPDLGTIIEYLAM